MHPFVYLTALEEAEIIPGKHSNNIIKPLALTHDHGRYITVGEQSPYRGGPKIT
jgi:hypothetical protein